MGPHPERRMTSAIGRWLLVCGLTVALAAAARAEARGIVQSSEGNSAGGGSPAEALDLVSISASKDNTLYESSNGSLSNGAGEHMFAGVTNTGRIRRGLVAFDVATEIPSGATIVSATLKLYVSRTSSGSQPISIHRVAEDWGEGASVAPGNGGAGTAAEVGDATWLHRTYDNLLWFTEGGSFNAAASATTDVAGEGMYSWGPTPEMTADVQLWLEYPLQSSGWLLLGPEDEDKTSKRFDTKENVAPSQRPALVVEYTMDTPTPSPTASITATPGPTNTQTATPTPTATRTASPSPTRTATPTHTATGSPAPTYTPSTTPSTTPTPDEMATATLTQTPLATDTETPTATAFIEETATSTGTLEPEATWTPTTTSTATPTHTAAASATKTETPADTSTVTATATSTSTRTPSSTVTVTCTPSEVPTSTSPPTPGLQPGVCAFILNRVPPVAIAAAIANPDSTGGWGERAVPGLPASPFNPPRHWLTIQSVSLPYHPLYNGLIYKAGCP